MRGNVLKMWNQYTWSRSKMMLSLIGITNNPSEGYNCHFKHEVFPTHQPTLPQYFGGLDREMEAQV